MLTHLLTSGDALHIIADKAGINWRDIASANQLDIFSQLPIGKMLDVPTPAEIAIEARQLAETELGKRFGSKAQQLVSWVLL